MIDTDRLEREPPAKMSPNYLALSLIVLVVAGLASVLAPNFLRARARGQLTACKSNLKNLGTACEMYSTDYKGLYPPSMNLLTPSYLHTIPTCPGAGTDTYSPTFQSHRHADRYTFFCGGNIHASGNELPNYPEYNSTQGLVT